MTAEGAGPRAAEARLTDAAYWRGHHADAHEEPPGFIFFEEVARHLPRQPGLSFLEIGCSPGRILAKFCSELGYEAHGIDFADDPQRIEAYLRAHSVDVGHIHRGDFFTWEPNRTYDVVASIGFVEHFGDPGAVIDRHFALVRPGGHVVVGVPNFARGQWLLHWLFDRPNLRRHNTVCMSLGYLEAAGRRNGAHALSVRYTGGHYDLWRETPRSARLGVPASSPRVWLSPPSAVHLALRRLAQTRPEAGNSWFSPFILAVFQAPEDASGT
jgi:cyclopropane fatty-acyl-phospholipid synthase-like methyltransferase